MKDYKLKQRNLRASHTLGRSSTKKIFKKLDYSTSIFFSFFKIGISIFIKSRATKIGLFWAQQVVNSSSRWTDKKSVRLSVHSSGGTGSVRILSNSTKSSKTSAKQVVQAVWVTTHHAMQSRYRFGRSHRFQRYSHCTKRPVSWPENLWPLTCLCSKANACRRVWTGAIARVWPFRSARTSSNHNVIEHER